MPISSRRYLSAYEHVVKYLGFAEKSANSHKLRGVNPNILPPQSPVEPLLRYRLSKTVIASLKFAKVSSRFNGEQHATC